jgi:hypothetical protein
MHFKSVPHLQKGAFTAERAKNAELFNGFVNNNADVLRFSQNLSSANSAVSAVKAFCSELICVIGEICGKFRLFQAKSETPKFWQ